MKLRPRLAALLVAAATAATPLGLAATTSAHADRCEPEELVLGPNTSPIDERDQPLCTVMFSYVYPFLCTGPNGETPPPTLPQCLQNIRLKATAITFRSCSSPEIVDPCLTCGGAQGSRITQVTCNLAERTQIHW